MENNRQSNCPEIKNAEVKSLRHFYFDLFHNKIIYQLIDKVNIRESMWTSCSFSMFSVYMFVDMCKQLTFNMLKHKLMGSQGYNPMPPKFKHEWPVSMQL